MSGRFIINAYSSNSAGGRSGLQSLLSAVPPDLETIAFVDARMAVPAEAKANLKYEFVPPSILGRIRAERKIQRIAKSGDFVLRLGSVPPLFKPGVPTFVFFENRYLFKSVSLAPLGVKNNLRVRLERLLVSLFKHNATCFIVQSESVATELRQTLVQKLDQKLDQAIPVQVLPFQLPAQISGKQAEKNIDFIYPATGDNHKNHHNLILAWIDLAAQNIRPSLYLTIDSKTYPQLAVQIDQAIKQHDLKIVNTGFLSVPELNEYYLRAKALVFPSLCESFGRPLAEAKMAGIPTLASEMDYVRDILDPAQSFDPCSPQSIARAVKRHLGLPEKRAPIHSPGEFISELRRQANRS